MNIIKRILTLMIAVTAMITVETFGIISGVLDWAMVTIVTSDKLCINCGHRFETITKKTPLCEECIAEMEDDTMAPPGEMTKDVMRMYR